MPDISNTATTNKYLESANIMVKTTTYRLAAALILDKNFPNNQDLPPIVPPAFNNFGHQLLLDYSLLLKIVWQVVTDIKQVIEKEARIVNLFRGLGILTITVVFIRSCYALNTSQLTFAINDLFLIILGIMIWSTIYFLAHKQHKRLYHKIAEIRAKAINELCQETWTLRSNTKLHSAIDQQVKDKDKDLAGDGIICTDRIPVLPIVDNRYPFPGYGPMLMDELFVCPPKKTKTDASEEKRSEIAIGALREAVDKAIKNFVTKDKIHYVNIGQVVVLHGKSLRTSLKNNRPNRWLDKYIPKLWITENELVGIDQSETQEASLRVYSAVQVLFPPYDTVATFFIRLFLAENSASCHIAVTTVGPINFSFNLFHRRLLKYRLDREREQREAIGYQQAIVQPIEQSSHSQNNPEQQKASDYQKNANKVDVRHHATELLRFTQQTTQNVTEFQAQRNFQEIQSLDYFKMEKEAKELYSHAEYIKATKESVAWPGIYFSKRTIRERFSLTVTDDFFGKTEVVATVKSLYSQIGRAVIDAFADLGFDVSEYRDKDGNYTINADRIDQLFIGEQIQVNQAKQASENESNEAPVNSIEMPKATTDGTVGSE